MPAISLADAVDREEPALSWRWRVEMPANLPGNTDADKYINMYAEMVDLPSTSVEFYPVFCQASTNHYPKSYLISTFDIHFYEDRNMSAHLFFTNWRNMVVDRKGNFGLAKDYKKTIRIFTIDGQGNDTQQFTFLGCFPVNLANYSLISDSTDRLRTIVTFSCDAGGRNEEFEGPANNFNETTIQTPVQPLNNN